MGVTGLWTVLQPCARPIKLESLNKKRLAVDASIWIYQFLKAVRDKEGNQLRNSHIVGFFRRICKLLFVGIKPVFVFDGGAPALKRQTITGRKQRREGRRDDAARTAGKLLAMQMQRLAEEEDSKRRSRSDNNKSEEPLPENVVYVDELTMTPAERQKNRKFRKKDAYDLPHLDSSMAEMGQPNDPRIMSLEELQQYAHQFNAGEDINVYDFSKIDFDSMFFQGLPPNDQYNILNAARLRSRLRMGYSKDQLDSQFPDRMAFSRFQIQRVTERNEYTQRLMRLQGMSIDGTLSDGLTRVAGEKGREYVLVRNEGVEGGWALGVVDTTGQRDQPIDVDELEKPPPPESDEESEEFEDVPIVTLDMLPRLPGKDRNTVTAPRKTFSNRRRRFYKARRSATGVKRKAVADPEALFVEESEESSSGESGVEDVDLDVDHDLQKAMALSMQHDHGDTMTGVQEDAEISPRLGSPVFAEQRRVEDPAPFFGGRGMTIAHAANARAMKSAKRPASKPFADESDSDDDIDSGKAVAQSKSKSKQQPVLAQSQQQSVSSNNSGFSGPLPFEKLNLGGSLFGRKRLDVTSAPALEPDPDAGGFVIEDPESTNEIATAKPLPPWFSAADDEPLVAVTNTIGEVASKKETQFTFDDIHTTNSSAEAEVINLDSDDEPHNQEVQPPTPKKELIDSVASNAGVIPAATPPSTRAPPKDALDEPQSESMEISLPKADPDMKPGQETPASPVIDQVPKADDGEDDEIDWEEVVVEKQPDSPGLDVMDQDSGQAVASQPKHSTSASRDSPDLDGPVISMPVAVQVPTLKHEESSMNVKVEDDDQFNYSDPEEEEMFRQLAQEEEEHLRFASTLNNRSLTSNMADFEAELKKLRVQQKKDLRDADEVTQTMITECQQLLALFGLPYITAPMEAEAQCAALVDLGLVDGVVTDDSDIFLFGGTRVFKNMFNQAKLVECYLTGDLEDEFNLTRERLIAIAQLLGSDYTEGLPGVGPVTALEILSEFDTLENFRDWFLAAQAGKITKAEDATNPVRKKFRRNITKLSLPTVFPDPRVQDAYLNPSVDSDPSDFVWGVPDLSALRAFLMANIGWSPERTDEILVPVIRDMNKRETEGTQSNITAFFGGTTGAGAFAPRRRAGGSSRLQSALQRIGNRPSGLSTEVSVQEQEPETATTATTAPAKKRAKRQKRS